MSRRSRKKRRKTTSSGKQSPNPILAPTCPFISAPPRHAKPDETPGERETRLSDFRLVVLALTVGHTRAYKAPTGARNAKMVPALCNIAAPVATLGHVRRSSKWSPITRLSSIPKQLNPSMVAGRMYSYQFTATHWQPVQQKEFRDVGLARVRRDLGTLPVPDLKELYRLWCSPELPSFGKGTLVNLLAEFFFSGTLLSERRDEEARVLKKTDVVNLYFPLLCPQETGEVKALTLPKDLMQSILAFLPYDTELLQSAGLVSWDWYVLVLSSWPHVKVTKTNVFAIPNLVLHSTRSVLVNLGYGKTALEAAEISHVMQTLGDRVRIMDFRFDDPSPVKNLYRAILRAKKHLSVRRFVLQRVSPPRWNQAIFMAMPKFHKLRFAVQDSNLMSASVENFSHIVNATTLVELSFRFSGSSRSLSYVSRSLPECPNLKRLHLSEGEAIDTRTRYVRVSPVSQDVSPLQDWLRSHIPGLTHLCVDVSKVETFDQVFSFAPSNSPGLQLCVAVPVLVPSVMKFLASFSELDFLSFVSRQPQRSAESIDLQLFVLGDSLSVVRITTNEWESALCLVRSYELTLTYFRLEHPTNHSGIVAFGDEIVVLYAMDRERALLEGYLRTFPLQNKSFFLRLRMNPSHYSYGGGYGWGMPDSKKKNDELATGLLKDQNVTFKELSRSQLHWVEPRRSDSTRRGAYRYIPHWNRPVHEYKGGVLFADADVPKRYWTEARDWRHIPVHEEPGRSSLRWDVW